MQDAAPSLRRDQTSGLTEVVTLVHGKHNLRFGGELPRNQLNSRTDQNARGTFTLQRPADQRASTPSGNPLAGTGFDFADFLLGLPQSSSIRFGSANTYFRERVYSRLRAGRLPRAVATLSFNLGLRYEFFSPFREKYGRMANLDMRPGFHRRGGGDAGRPPAPTPARFRAA